MKLWNISRFLKTSKQEDSDASEYHPNHCHMERGGSETHPKRPSAPSSQHPVLTGTHQPFGGVTMIKGIKFEA